MTGSGLDPEVEAMSKMAAAVSGLDDEQRARAIRWLADRHGVGVSGKPMKPTTKTVSTTDGGAGDEEDFADLPALMAAARPKTGTDRALVAAYWYQVLQNGADFDSQTINRDLKHMGHGLSNVTKTLSDLIKQKPQLVIQTHKTGTSQQGRKKYRLTTPGIEKVLGMLQPGDED